MKRLSGALLVVVGLACPAIGCGPGAQDPNAPVGITVSENYVTIVNRTGSAIADGQIELVPSGVLAPYKLAMPRIESGADRDISFDLFAGVGGARFRRGVTRMKSVRVTATDIAGNKYQEEVPFD
jgi:hypothetical protein